MPLQPQPVFAGIHLPSRAKINSGASLLSFNQSDLSYWRLYGADRGAFEMTETRHIFYKYHDDQR